MDVLATLRIAFKRLGANVVVMALVLAIVGAVAFNVAYAYAWSVSAFPWPLHEKAWTASFVVVGSLWGVFALVLWGWRRLVRDAEHAAMETERGKLETERHEMRRSTAIGDTHGWLIANLRGVLNDGKNAKSRTLTPLRKLLDTHDKAVQKIKEQDE